MRCWWPKSYERFEYSEAEPRVTLLAAISVWGCEYFMLVKGGVNMLTFVHFMNELEKIIIPKMEKRLKKYNFKKE